MKEDRGNDRRIGEERENPHGTTAARAEQRQYAIDTSEEHGPADAGGTCGTGWSIVTRSPPNREGAGRRIIRTLALRPTDSYDGST